MSYNINWVDLTKQQFDWLKLNKLVVLKEYFNNKGWVNNWISVSLCDEKRPLNAIVTEISWKDFNTAFSKAKKQYQNKIGLEYLGKRKK